MRKSKHDSFKVIVYFVAVASLALVLTISCGQPIQIPDPIPVEELYEYLSREKVDNPTRLERRVDTRQIISFGGSIEKIEGSAVQFLIEERMAGRDAYVECGFARESAVVRLNRGQQVTVYGKLDEAFAGGLAGITGDGLAVKFKDCGLYPSS